MICKDPSVTYLKSFGYNVVTLPKASIRPLQIFVKKYGRLQHLGDITDVIKPNDNTVTIPLIEEDSVVSQISGKRTSNLSVGVGLSILGSIIGGLGGSKIGLDANYKNAKSVTFEFSDVLEDSVSPTDLDKYLGSSDIDSRSRQVQDFLESDDIFITTAVIKSNKIKVVASKEGEGKVELNLPEVQKLIGADVKVSADSTQNSLVTYEGNVRLVFGFKAVRLFYNEGRYTAFKFSKAGATPFSQVENKSIDGYMEESPVVGFVGL